MEILVSLGQSVGLAGVAAGIFFLLFKEIIRKNIYPQLDQDRGFRLLRTIISYVFVFSVIIALLATLVQLVTTGRLTTIGINWQRGETKLGVVVSFEHFKAIVRANAADLPEQDRVLETRVVGNLEAAYQRYTVAGNRLQERLVNLRQENGFADVLSATVMQRVSSQVQRGELRNLGSLFAKLTKAGATEQGPTRDHVAEAGYLMGQLHEASLQLNEAVEFYKHVLDYDPTHYRSIQALTYILLERGQREDALALTERVLKFVRRNRAGDNLLVSQLLTTRADALMWSARFQEADACLLEAAEVSEQALLPDIASRNAAIDRLNSSSGLYQNLGQTSRALKSIRSALALVAPGDDPRTILNLELNHAVILLDGGHFGDATQIIDRVRPKIDSLPQADIYRGYYHLLSAYAGLRMRNLVSAAISLRSARDFFMTAFSTGSVPIRMARLRCLEHRLAYLTGEDASALAASDECLSWTLMSGPGRVGDLIESRYLRNKAALRGGGVAQFAAKLDESLELPPMIKERARLSDALVAAGLAIDGNNSEDVQYQLDQLIVEFAALENRTGMLLDMLTDAILLRTKGSFTGDRALTVEGMNALRQQVGARPIS